MSYYDLDKKTKSWIKQGRGSGNGKEYKPWITIRDLPSEGRSYRIYGFSTKRTHHLLSDLELAAFLFYEWNTAVIDIREQFPLKYEDTLVIAQERRVRHPTIGGYLKVMSSDFLIDIDGNKETQFAIQVKYVNDLKDKRVIEKLEIERRYWEQKGISWYLVTERNIPKTITNNIKWLYSSIPQEEEHSRLIAQLPMYVDFFKDHKSFRISEIAMKIDKAYSLEVGESLRTIRSLLAMRYLLFDLRQEWSGISVDEIRVVQDFNIVRDSYAAG
jgi:hypothetical protein